MSGGTYIPTARLLRYSALTSSETAAVRYEPVNIVEKVVVVVV